MQIFPPWQLSCGLQWNRVFPERAAAELAGRQPKEANGRYCRHQLRCGARAAAWMEAAAATAAGQPFQLSPEVLEAPWPRLQQHLPQQVV